MTAHQIDLADLDFTVDPTVVKLNVLSRRLSVLRAEVIGLMESSLDTRMAEVEDERRYDADEDDWVSE